MQLAPIVSRVGELTEFGGRVFLAATGDEAVEFIKVRSPAGVPSAAVIGPREVARENESMGGISQRVDVSFSVVTCVRYAGDAMSGYAQMDALRATLRAKLVGWAPASGYRKLQVGNSALLLSAPSLLVWGDVFKTHHRVEA